MGMPAAWISCGRICSSRCCWVIRPPRRGRWHRSLRGVLRTPIRVRTPPEAPARALAKRLRPGTLVGPVRDPVETLVRALAPVEVGLLRAGTLVPAGTFVGALDLATASPLPVGAVRMANGLRVTASI